jgi:hypothetical protein
MKNQTDQIDLELAEPLWMPRGSVHALITIALVVFWCAVVFKGGDLPEDLKALASLFIGLYAGKRSSGNTVISQGMVGVKK